MLEPDRRDELLRGEVDDEGVNEDEEVLGEEELLPLREFRLELQQSDDEGTGCSGSNRGKRCCAGWCVFLPLISCFVCRAGMSVSFACCWLQVVQHSR